ncbi:MAG: glycosyltransferase [Bdellovibrionales bacterium]|nr:glycosyltransferase [Bdellovibrionales bacterium]
MKVGYVATTVFPHYWVDTQQVVKNANALSLAGCEVDLIIPRKWDRYFFSSNEKRKKILSDFYGVDIQFNLMQIPHIPPTQLHLQKIPHGMLIPLLTFFKKYDVIYTRAFWTLAMCSLFGIPCVLENHRLLKDHYQTYYKIFYACLQSGALKGVVTNAQVISDHYTSIGVPSNRVLTAHNCFDPEDALPVLTKTDARKKIGLDNQKKYICYAGNIRRYKGIELIIQMAKELPEFTFIICGGYPQDVEDAKALANTYGVTNMDFRGFIQVADLSTYLYAADFLLIPPSAKPFEQHKKTVLPIKTYTYLSIGRPILAPKMGDIEEVLHDGKNAILLPPDNLLEITKTIRAYAQDEAALIQISRQALEDARLYTWETRGQNIKAFLEAVL